MIERLLFVADFAVSEVDDLPVVARAVFDAADGVGAIADEGVRVARAVGLGAEPLAAGGSAEEQPADSDRSRGPRPLSAGRF